MKREKKRSKPKAAPSSSGKLKAGDHVPAPEDEKNDYGGLPRIDLKKNLGCGG